MIYLLVTSKLKTDKQLYFFICFLWLPSIKSSHQNWKPDGATVLGVRTLKTIYTVKMEYKRVSNNKCFAAKVMIYEMTTLKHNFQHYTLFLHISRRNNKSLHDSHILRWSEKPISIFSNNLGLKINQVWQHPPKVHMLMESFQTYW